MKLDKINTLILLTLVAAFCVFVVFWEKTDLKNTKKELKEHAQVIAISLWNLDPEGPSEYLKLAAKLNNHEHITVFAVTDELFIEVTGQEVGQLDKFFLKIGLIPKVKLNTDISFNGRVVGSIEVVHLHDTIYVYLYLLIIMGLILLVEIFFTQTLQAKHTLEERVQERTEELKVANKKLLLSEERYREIFNTPSDAIFMHDADTGKILDVNQGMLSMYGYTFEEALQLDIGNISSGESHYTIEEAGLKVQDAIQQGPQLFEWMGKKKNEDFFWAEVALKYTEFGGHQYVVAVVRNINDRKLAEKQIERSNALLKSLIDSIPDLIFYKDKESVYLGCNEAFARFVGQDKEAIVGRTDLDLFEKDIAEFFQTKDRQMLAEDKSRRNEEWVEYPDGRHVLLDTLKTPFYTSDNKVLGLIGVSRDLTERKQAEADIAAEKERLAVTLRSIGDGVITTDISGNVVLLNKIAENLTGWPNEEAVGRPLEEVFNIINEQTREICENPAKKVINSGQIVGLANHTILVARDGKELSIADSGAPILDADSSIIGVVLVFRDVSEQIKTEKELLKIRKLESVGVLAGGIAHDFNNILAAILGNVNLAALDPNLSSDTKKLLAEAEKASLRAKGLTQQLLTFSKGGEPVKEVASLESVIKDSADFVLHGDKVVCRYERPENLWLVDIDKGQMSQVVQNIVLNASHAMPGGGTIQISCRNIDPLHVEGIDLPRDKNFVEVTITDGGIGIPANIIEKIFDPYFTTKQKGSGLGLAISHSIITKHNGHVILKSTPGVGTTFTLYIPASAHQQEKKTREEDAEGGKGTAKIKIMVMDDDEMIRDVVKSMLSHQGHDVVLAHDGAEALEVYREHHDSGKPIDIIIMDLTIPGGMGGKDAIKEVLAFDADAKVIVSSGYSNDPIMAHCREYGFYASIIKPFQLQELTRVINQVMTQGQQ